MKPKESEIIKSIIRVETKPLSEEEDNRAKKVIRELINHQIKKGLELKKRDDARLHNSLIKSAIAYELDEIDEEKKKVHLKLERKTIYHIEKEMTKERYEELANHIKNENNSYKGSNWVFMMGSNFSDIVPDDWTDEGDIYSDWDDEVDKL